MTVEPLESRRLFAAYVLDKAFGSSGVLDTRDAAIGDVAPTQTLIDAEGRVLVVTPYSLTPGGNRQLAIRRYHADGSIDQTFDADGKLVIEIGSAKQPDPLVTLLNDNSVIVAMRQTTLPLLQRYNVKGKLDASFAKNVGSAYKIFKIGEPIARHDHLCTDPQGRIVYTQYLSAVEGYQINAPTNPDERINARISRYLSTGFADQTFGTRGGMTLSQPVNSPLSYKVQGRTLSRRYSMMFAEPQIDADNNVVVAGGRGYARGSTAGSGSGFSEVRLPFAFTFAGSGRIVREFVSPVDLSKASYNVDKLTYTGVQTLPSAAVVTSDGTLYMSGSVDQQIINNTYTSGLAVLKPTKNSYVASGFDPTFEINILQKYGDRVWALQAGPRGLISRLNAVNDDASTGETIGIGSTFNDPRKGPFTFAGVSNGRPLRILGFTDYQELDIRSLNLSKQEGRAVMVNGTVKITGTAGEDFIDIRQRLSDGRYIVTGAGVTRSFSAKQVKKFEVDLAGGDDLFNVDYGITIDVAVFGGAGDDYIRCADGNDYATGGSGNDTVKGDSGNDTVRGESGDDSLEGNGGADFLYGGSGTDSSFRLTGATYDSIELGI